jgi:membrane fusion protein, multidrug efflux system
MRALLRKSIGILISLAAFAGMIVLATLTIWRIDVRPRTDDAYLQADVVHMAPEVSGRIIELAVRDNQAVHRGDALFRIDPVPFQLRVDQAQAAVRGLEAKLGLTADQVAAQTSSADTAGRGIATAEAQLTLATSTLARMRPLLPSGYVTAEQVDQARTAKQPAEIALQQARLQALNARQAISNTKPAAQELEAMAGSRRWTSLPGNSPLPASRCSRSLTPRIGMPSGISVRLTSWGLDRASAPWFMLCSRRRRLCMV